jgi:mono/diheme cytochrome c family protein
MLSAHALLLMEKYNTANNVKAMTAAASNLFNKNNPVINFYLAVSLGPWTKVAPGTFLPLLAKIANTYADRAIYQEAVVSSINGLEGSFQKMLGKNTAGNKSNQLLESLLVQTIKNRQEGKKNSIFVQAKTPIDSRTNGFEIFRTTCAPCHGVDGDGVEHVGPPLKGSEYVHGSPDRLAMIILNGLEGPVHINGQLYKFNGTMPNFGNNFSDNQISDIIKYLHNAYASKTVKPINSEKIKELRSKKSGTLTEKDLLQMENLKVDCDN